MKIKIMRRDYSDSPASMQRLGWKKQTQILVSAGKVYDVHALAVVSNLVLLLVSNDLSLPDWIPAWLGSVEEASLEDDWISTFWESDPVVLIGPPFIAESPTAYRAMVDREPEQQDRLEAYLAMKRRQVRAVRKLGDMVPAGAIGVVLEVYRGKPNSYLIEFYFKGAVVDVITVSQDDLLISGEYMQELLQA